jgi:hypothetical protein
VAGIVITMVAFAFAVAHAWPEGVDARRLVDDVAAAQAQVDVPRRATLLERRVPPSSFARRARADGWRPVAIWDLEVHGREAVTVVWEKAGHRVVHSRLDGPPAGRPEGSGRTGRSGILLYALEGDLRNLVTWTEEGRTAVVSAADLLVAELYDLAGGAPAG